MAMIEAKARTLRELVSPGPVSEDLVGKMAAKERADLDTMLGPLASAIRGSAG
jgi:hypothetical protein